MPDAGVLGCRMMDAAAKTVGNRRLGARSDVRNLPITLPEEAAWLGWESRRTTSSARLLPFLVHMLLYGYIMVFCTNIAAYSCDSELEASTHPPTQLCCTVTQHL
ncbi:hypothetical protein CORC01_04312 [Colletotrichum orchidophilum]|uniref:Uncharacterized protein n=1 Tax=Colletotrichum orchidophilum TaxID=1209926 RepID=A0A1G4BG33_9PEZI|nr:uncharacterized protein CORC01_04312 [Colletotrichum orchidophilum]OHF00331.1 hypothetical protein CORC01_04312 [Colletotrichum orchidophilum]